ncbi:hypothetical protein CWO05_06525 [Vibrio splendidus]|nr:hypothetical protein CWO05_06525 [Vibrio splendidus]
MAVSFLMSPLPASTRDSLLGSFLALGSDEGNTNKPRFPITFVPHFRDDEGKINKPRVPITFVTHFRE